MKIIIDTREQKPLKFTGHETIRRKLDEGDYNVEELENEIVIERKTVEDFYGTITRGHNRFKNEILRARDKNKKFYMFLEGSINDVLDYVRTRGRNSEAIRKTIKTMELRYELIFVECKTRISMSRQIVKTIENEMNTRR